MIELRDIDNRKYTADYEKGSTLEVEFDKRVTIEIELNPVSIFKTLTDLGLLSSEDLYELGSYLKTYAEVHK